MNAERWKGYANNSHNSLRDKHSRNSKQVMTDSALLLKILARALKNSLATNLSEQSLLLPTETSTSMTLPGSKSHLSKKLSERDKVVANSTGFFLRNKI